MRPQALGANKFALNALIQ